jgi:hypothetical protein
VLPPRLLTGTYRLAEAFLSCFVFFCFPDVFGVPIGFFRSLFAIDCVLIFSLFFFSLAEIAPKPSCLISSTC